MTTKLWHDKPDFKHSHRKQVQDYCYGRPIPVAQISQDHQALMPLLRFDSNAIQEADRNIVEYFHPYALFLAATFGSELSSLEREIQEISDKYPKQTEGDEDMVVESILESIEPVVHDFNRLRVSLDRCCHHLSQFVRKHPSPKMTSLLEDYRTIVEHAKEFERNTKLSAQLWIGLADAEEARESRIEANQVRALTILAFIFIPIQFITGIFGLDFDAVSDVPREIKFGITACVTMVIISLSLICVYIILGFTKNVAKRSKSHAILGKLSKPPV